MGWEIRDIIMYGMTALFVLVILCGLKNIFLLKIKGKSVLADVMKKEVLKGSRNFNFYITYKFFVDDASVQNRVPVGKKTFDTYQEGEKIGILFSPNKPSVNLIDTDSSRMIQLSVFLLVFFSFICAWYFFEWDFGDGWSWSKTISLNTEKY